MVVVAVAAALIAGCTGPPADAAATVNGDAIPESDFAMMVRTQAESPEGPVAGLEGAERTSRIAELQRQLLTQLIRLELVSQIADERGIEVTEAAIEERWQQEVEARGGVEALRDLIASLGLTEEQARQQIAAQIQQESLRESVAEEVDVSEAQVRELYESRIDQFQQADVAHILVEDEAEAEAVVDLLEQGQPFDELAAERSIDEASAVQGGALGVQPRGAYVEPFDEAVWAAEEGEIVGPVETQFGWHVIRVDEFVEQSFADVEEQLRQELVSQEVDELFRALVTSLFEDADVTVDSRFGEWDPTTGQVVALNRIAPQSEPLQTVPPGS